MYYIMVIAILTVLLLFSKALRMVIDTVMREKEAEYLKEMRKDEE